MNESNLFLTDVCHFCLTWVKFLNVTFGFNLICNDKRMNVIQLRSMCVILID